MRWVCRSNRTPDPTGWWRREENGLGTTLDNVVVLTG
jgi:hypothetical protein